MLSGKMGHQNQVIIYNLSSALPYGDTTWTEEKKEEGQGQVIKSSPTRVTQRSFSREYHGPALLFYPNRVTCAIRFELALQFS
jgi:hypothetical protein